jgi:hypothetical protein
VRVSWCFSLSLTPEKVAKTVKYMDPCLLYSYIANFIL